jgi:hypothetical protein
MLSTNTLKWVAGALVLYFIIFIVKFEMQAETMTSDRHGGGKGKHKLFPHNDAGFSGESAGSRKQNQKHVAHAGARIDGAPPTQNPQRPDHGKVVVGGGKKHELHQKNIAAHGKAPTDAPVEKEHHARKHTELGKATGAGDTVNAKHDATGHHHNAKNADPVALPNKPVHHETPQHPKAHDTRKPEEEAKHEKVKPEAAILKHENGKEPHNIHAHGSKVPEAHPHAGEHGGHHSRAPAPDHNLKPEAARHVPHAPANHRVHPARRHGSGGAQAIVTVVEPVAFAVVISNEDFIDGALVMGMSFWNQSHLVQIGNATLVAIVPQGAVSSESIERLQLAGWSHVLQVEDLTKYSAPHAHYAATFNKLYLFNLTEYHRVATFDVDMLMLRNPDGVFRTQLTDDQWIGALGNSHRKNHSYFQTGMMLIVPSAKSFKWLMHEFRSNPHQRDMNGRDGRLIRDYFKDRYINLDSALSAHLGIHEPLDSVIGFHFRGEFKPWFNKEFPPTHPAYGDKSGKVMEQELGEAYRLWWGVYELLHRTKLAEHDVGPKRATDLPAGYDSAKSVWLMRHTSRSYLQTLSDVDAVDRNRTYPGMRIEVSDAGKSCDETCASQQSVCRHDALSFTELNHCGMLQRVFGCHKCTMDYPGSEEPAYDTLTRVCYRNPLDYKAQRPTCNATMSGHERLCPCVPIEHAYDHSTAYDGRIQLMSLLKHNEKSAEPPLEPKGLHSVSGCFPTKADYFGSDSKCTNYLKDLDNVAWISVLGRASLVGRTVKVMFHYKEPNIKAVVKFPQKTFPHEAQSEVASYAVDRVLGVHRVPPTAFTYFPLDRLRATLANATAQNTDPNMKSSLAGLSVELLEFLVQQGVGDLVRKRDGGLEVGVSVQLWMEDVHRLADSVYRDAAAAPHPASPHHHNVAVSPLALFFKKHSASKPHEAVLLELSRMLVFDFIIGNDDRTPTKNTFVLGGCQGPRCGPGRSAFRFEGEHPQLALVDQGRSFYFVGNPEDNALSTPQAHDVCLFPKDLIEACLSLSHNRTTVGSLRRMNDGDKKASGADPFTNAATLERSLFSQLPKEVQAVLHEDAIHAAQDRLERLLHHVDSCVARTKGSDAEHVLRSP